MDGEQVLEFAARAIDGGVEIRTTRDENPQYPVAQWARDQQALGARVQRRRIVVLEDWADLPPRLSAH
jgi:hypothetical protein